MLKPDNSWTLFLDRDGVINIEKEADYIHTWEEFRFYDGAAEAIATLSQLFGRTIVVTNQKGIGKGLTRREDVDVIHQKMRKAIEAAGGHIDAIYYCPDIEDTSPCRKPNPGMAFQAMMDLPGIVPEKSIMVGNNLSDLMFGRNAGLHTIFLHTTLPGLQLPQGLADMEANDLPDLAEKLSSLFRDR